MKLRAQVEGLAVRAIFAAVLAKNALVKIVDDREVDIADTEDDFCVGRAVKPAKAIDGTGTVETRFKELIEIRADGAIAAGEFVKIGSVDTGLQCVTEFVPGTDSPELLFGVCWFGGADNATVEVLVF